jgi:hypothetical protein
VSGLRQGGDLKATLAHLMSAAKEQGSCAHATLHHGRLHGTTSGVVLEHMQSTAVVVVPCLAGDLRKCLPAGVVFQPAYM